MSGAAAGDDAAGGPAPRADGHPGPLAILHRDAHLAVVSKPSGLPVHRGWDNERFAAMLLAREQLDAWIWPVHRLDRGASGALVFALDAATAAALHTAFEAGAVRKRYVALVRGEVRGPCVVDHALERREGGPKVPALTHVWPVARSPVERCSLVEAQPHTGRPHQIRRHLKHLSCPLIGDATHGKGPLNRELRARYGLARLALHAFALELVHPVTGERLVVRAPLPDDLLAPLERLGLADAARALVDSPAPAEPPPGAPPPPAGAPPPPAGAPPPPAGAPPPPPAPPQI